MDRQALEALSAAELQRIIGDAAAVLASRAGAADAGGRPASPAAPAAPAAAAPGSGTGSLFTFGAASSSSAAVAESSGPSNPFATTKSIFGPNSATGGSKLFGTGGGLFSELGSEPQASLFSPPSRAVGSEAAEGSAVQAAEGEKGGCEAGEGADGDDDRFVPHEEVTLIQGWTPSITLEVCGSIETGEEQEEQIYSQRSKLYRFRDGEWKERGLGEARLLKDKSTGRIRFLLRQEKTGKVAANFFVMDRKPYCDLRPNADSEKIWVWCAQDFSDGEAHVEELALKFSTVDLAGEFKKAFEDAKSQNSKLMAEEVKASESKDSGKSASEASK